MISKSNIEFNKKVHNKIAKNYEKKHTEIYNRIEQNRLKKSLTKSMSCIETTACRVKALDVGCGAGNLTSHLIDLGAEVTAADISVNFLKLIELKYNNVSTHILNGEDLREIPDSTYDIVVMYSVLHHIPDYLKTVEEMCRVLKPGGVLYIDHEKNEKFWLRDELLLEFYLKQRYSNIPVKIIRKLKNFFNPKWYINKYRCLNNPKYQEEGDIHVWQDDHVEWDMVKSKVKKCNLQIVEEIDFLHFNSKYTRSIFNHYENITSDMKAVIFKKLL